MKEGLVSALLYFSFDGLCGSLLLLGRRKVPHNMTTQSAGRIKDRLDPPWLFCCEG